jgi:hypothetical protein
MDLSNYVKRYVRIDLINGFYYEGLVLSADDDSLELNDKNGKLVVISKASISFLREVGK